MSRMRALAPRMIGRQAQLDKLEEHLRAVRAASCRVVLVAGEAGVGKSRLLRAFLEGVQGQPGIEVLQGHCFEEQPPAAYGPFLDALRAFVHVRGPHPVVAAAGPLAADLLPLLPELELPPPGPGALDDPQARKQRLFAALYRALRPPAAGRARILVLEDLHWADQTSLELLRYLALAGEGEPLLLLGTYRADEVDQHHPLQHTLAQLTRDRRLHEVPVSPLDRPALTGMLEATLGRAVPEAFLAAMAERTGGNPFFVEEILGTLLDAGHLDAALQGAQGGSHPIRPLIPRSIKASIHSRTAGLDEATTEVLHFAAVIGRRFDLQVLLRVTGLEETALIRAMSRLVERQVVVEERGDREDRFSFRHALSREAIYDDLLGLDRRRRHRAVLDTLEELYPIRGEAVLDQLAYHSMEAGERAKAARYAEQAGNRSARMSAFREAMGHYQTALELLETADPRQRAELLITLGEAAFPLGDAAVYERCLREAQQLYEQIGDRRRSGDLSSRLGHAVQDRGDMATALAHFRAAIAALEAEPPGPELAMAYGELANYHRLGNRLHEAIEWGKKAHRLAAALADLQVEAYALGTIGIALRDLGDWWRGVGYLERSLTLAREVNHAQGTLRVYMHLGLSLAYAGEFRRAATVYAEGMAVAGRLGWEVRMGGDSGFGGWALLELGRWHEAHEALDRALRAAELGHPFARLRAAPWKAVLLLRQGRFDEARRLLEEVLPEFEAYDSDFTIGRGLPEVYAAQALVRLALTDQTGALRAMDQAIALWRGVGSPAWGGGLLIFGVEIYPGAGREEQAWGLLPALAALAERAATPLAHAGLADAQGRVAASQSKHAEATEAFRRAAALWREMGAIYNEARSRRLRAESLLRSGDPGHCEEARTELATAQAICASLGAPLELAAIADTMRRHGLVPQPVQRARGRTDGLTRREREVLTLIAQGCSNRAIAERLVIAEKTVETHVGNILGKLGCTSRAQAAAYAVEHGLAASATP